MITEKRLFVLVEEYKTQTRGGTKNYGGYTYKSRVRDSDDFHRVWINLDKVTHMEEVRHYYLDDKTPKGDAVIYFHVEGSEKTFIFKGSMDELLDRIEDEKRGE